MSLIKVIVVKQSKNWLSLKNIKNLAKFKIFKNFTKGEKLIKNLVKFKISKEFSFLSLAA